MEQVITCYGRRGIWTRELAEGLSQPYWRRLEGGKKGGRKIGRSVFHLVFLDKTPSAKERVKGRKGKRRKKKEGKERSCKRASSYLGEFYWGGKLCPREKKEKGVGSSFSILLHTSWSRGKTREGEKGKN